MVSSHLRPGKGLLDLINAYQMLSDSGKKKAIIDIYGDGPQREELIQLIQNYQLESFINLKGNIKEIHEKYAEYDYLIHPSHSETFCYAVVEALLADIPVITTHGAGNILNLIVNGKNGYLYPIGDVQKLTSIMQKVIDEQIMLKIDNRKYYATIFSTEQMVENYIKIL